MQFNVAQLLKEPIGAVRRFELADTVEELDPELSLLGPIVGTLQLMRIHSGILATGEFSTALQVTCNRCLAPIASPVRFQIEENFRPLTEVSTGRYLLPQEFEGTRDDLEDSALLINEQHILNIAEVVRQAIWLALPMYPGCNWEGSDECPNLTTYLNEAVGVEMHPVAESVSDLPEESIDPRWAALLALKGQLEDEN